tara:strand:- start:41 stop:406 length:366 start_codon:yes stop_codon:yes gene_type:complete
MAKTKDMDDEQMFMEAVESAMASKSPEEAEPEQAEEPEPEQAEEPEPEQAPEEGVDEDTEKEDQMVEMAKELFMAIFGSEFDPETEDHAMLMEQIVEKMGDPEYADLNPNQFALKMFRDME